MRITAPNVASGISSSPLNLFVFSRPFASITFFLLLSFLMLGCELIDQTPGVENNSAGSSSGSSNSLNGSPGNESSGADTADQRDGDQEIVYGPQGGKGSVGGRGLPGGPGPGGPAASVDEARILIASALANSSVSPGPAGPVGPAGERGATGPAGRRGPSLTEAELIALIQETIDGSEPIPDGALSDIGPDGSPGMDGLPGFEGPAGPAGP